MKGSYKKTRKSEERRFNNRVFVELDIVAYFDNKEFTTKMRNLSGNGIQIVQPPELEIQEKQDCHILLKDEEKELKLNAQVVWNEFGLIGLCFEKQSQKIQKQLNNLSNKLLSSMSAKDNPELV